MQKLTWPAVALVLVMCAFLFGIFIAIPADQPQLRTMLLGFVVLAGNAVVAVVSTKSGHDVAERVASLEDEVRKGSADG